VIALPLHHYDDAGRIKPPLWLYGLILLGCRDLLLLIFALAIRSQTSQLLALFYPNHEQFLYYVLMGGPFLICFVLLGFREKCWQRSHVNWCRLLKPLMLTGFTLQLLYQLTLLQLAHWEFHFGAALTLAISCGGIWTLFISYHLKVMIADWLRPTGDKVGP
jgi:hypothetical protein